MNKYQNLSDPVKNLLILMHGSKKAIFDAPSNLLQDLLINYDTIVGNYEYVVKIAESIYLEVESQVDPDLYFLSMIETFLLTRNNQIEVVDNIYACRGDLPPKCKSELGKLISIQTSNRLVA